MTGSGPGFRLSLVLALAFALDACSAARAPAPAPPNAAPPPAAEGARRQTIAVFPFANDGVTGHERLEFLRDWLPDTIASTLETAGELRVVERREILHILEEQKLGSSALASKEGRVELGKIAGAQTMIFGDFAAIGDLLQISARVVDAESGVVLKSATARGAVGAARTLGEDLSQRLAHDLGLTVTRAARAAGVAGDRALAEAELYYRGLDHERRGESDAAIESYRQALEIDPNDREARAHLKKLLAASH